MSPATTFWLISLSSTTIILSAGSELLVVLEEEACVSGVTSFFCISMSVFAWIFAGAFTGLFKGAFSAAFCAIIFCFCVAEMSTGGTSLSLALPDCIVNEKKKLLPSSGVLLILICPPIALISFWHIASPRPDPPYLRLVLLSA